MIATRKLYLLIGALAVEAMLGLAVRSDEIHGFATGDHNFSNSLAVFGTLWLAVVLVCAANVARSVVATRLALHRHEQAIASVGALTPDWLWEADANQRLTYSSKGVAAILGYEPEQVIGRRIPDLVAEEHVETVEKLFRRSTALTVGWDRIELNWRHADGHDVLLEGSSTPMLNPAGTVVGFRGARRPVSDAATAARRAETARRRVDELIANRAIDIALQPVVDVTRGRMVGVEALARFRDGHGPEEWLTEAREAGRVLQLDLLLFEAALELIPHIPSACYLAVNATPELLSDEHFHDLLRRTRMPLDRLVIEVTEQVRINSYAQVNQTLEPFRARGVRLAIDDTGAGFASLSHVVQLRPNIIKIDRSLVTDISTDPARRSAVTALVLLGFDLGAVVTAEGVETLAELEELERLGVANAQGYLLARPTTDGDQWHRWETRNWTQPADARASVHV